MKPKKIKWLAQPLLPATSTDKRESHEFDDLVLHRDGSLFICNKGFGRDDEVDYAFPDGNAHAKRERRSKRLVIKTTEPQVYVFEYRSVFRWFFRGWYRLVPCEKD